jgi:hypothetical protein
MTHTVINSPSVLAEAHQKLFDDLQELDDSARPASTEGLSQLRTRLSAIRRHISDHFRFEEQNGYMAPLRTAEPRLERIIERLAGDHERLLCGLDMLIGEAESALELEDSLRLKIMSWIEKVRQHEVHENDLFQEVYGSDTAAAD